MKEVNEQEFNDFLEEYKKNKNEIVMRESGFIHPVTVSFFHDNERIAAAIVHERDNPNSTMSYFIKDK